MSAESVPHSVPTEAPDGRTPLSAKGFNLKPLALWGSLFLVFALLYARALDYEFVWDDELWYERTRALRGPLLGGLSQSIFDLVEVQRDRPSHESYRPLAFLSAWLDVNWGGGSPRAAHLQSILLSLLYLPLWSAWGRRLGWSRKRSVITAAIFVLHPLQAEVIAYISGRPDLIAGLCWLGSFVLALSPPSRTRTFELLRLLCVALLFVASLLSKEGAIGLPVAFLLLVCARGELKKRLKESFALFVGLGAYLAIRLTMTASPPQSLPILDAFLRLPGMGLRLLTSFFLPVDLSISRQPDPGVSTPAWLITVAAMAQILASAWRQRTRDKQGGPPIAERTITWLSVGWLGFVTLIGPSSVVAIEQQTLSDRYAHGASLFLLTCLSEAGLCLRAILKKGRLAQPLIVGVGGVGLALLLALSWVQVSFWASPFTIYQRAVAAAPGSPDAHYGLGVHYLEATEFSLAEDHFKMATSLQPHNAKFWNDLGGVQMQLGRDNDAYQSYLNTIRWGARDDFVPLLNLALLSLKSAQHAQACTWFGRAKAAAPANALVSKLAGDNCAQLRQ